MESIQYDMTGLTFLYLNFKNNTTYICMSPCYGVVRASWVGLVTTLTAYVEGGGGAVWRPTPGDKRVTQPRL